MSLPRYAFMYRKSILHQATTEDSMYFRNTSDPDYVFKFTLNVSVPARFRKTRLYYLRTGPGHVLLARRQGFMAPTLRVGIYCPHPKGSVLWLLTHGSDFMTPTLRSVLWPWVPSARGLSFTFIGAFRWPARVWKVSEDSRSVAPVIFPREKL